jgi:DNA-binding MarR family transcriptional regulator
MIFCVSPHCDEPESAPRPGAAPPDEAPGADGAVTSSALNSQGSVGFMISTTGYAIGSRFREILAPLQLEPRDFSLLRAVDLAEGLSQQALAERLQIPASRLVAFIDALAQRGLIERRQNPSDRRVRALHLTTEGRELLRRAFALAIEHERRICADLGADEREQLLGLLGRVGAQLGLAGGVHAAHAALTGSK